MVRMPQNLHDSEEGAGAERRVKPRRRTLKQAQLIFRDGHCLIDCTVLDMSESGARLKPLEPMSCPDEFDLKLKYGPRRPCEVVWQKGGVLGVRFVE
jgi:hypothetical protein